MKPFPSSRERIAASALLLLSAETPSLSPKKASSSFCIDDDGESIKEQSKTKSAKERLVLSDSKSCSSSLTSDDGSSEGIRARYLKIITVVARCSEMKLKVVRKSRSKNYRRSDCRKMTSGKAAMMMMTTSGSVSKITDASCSSAISRARSGYAMRAREKDHGVRREESKRKHVGSAHMRRRAEAILRLLSGGCSSEVRIRQVLGDSPDTSKALRMLLRLEEIKRSGAGGRRDPYIYTIAQ